MEYRVTQNDNLDKLMEQVNYAIRSGWVPIGGIRHSRRPWVGEVDYFSQALTRTHETGVEGAPKP